MQSRCPGSDSYYMLYQVRNLVLVNFYMLHYSYVFSSMMLVHPKDGGSAWDTRVLLARHGVWLILQNFYNRLTQTARDHVDTAAGGAFFSLTPERATSLIEKMVSNQDWSDDRLQSRQRRMHSVKEADMLAAKIDLLLKKFEGYP